MKLKSSLFFFAWTVLLLSCSNSESPKTTTSQQLKEEITELESTNTELDSTANEIDSDIKALDEALKDLE